MTFEEWIKEQPNGHYLSADIFAAGATSREAEIAELVAALEHFYNAWEAGRTSVDMTAIRIAKEALAKVRKPT